MTQTDKLFEILKDGKAHRADELLREVYAIQEGPTVARLSARKLDVENKFGVEITSWSDPNNRKLWFYRLVKNPEGQSTKISSIGVQAPRVAPGTQAVLFHVEQRFTNHWD